MIVSIEYVKDEIADANGEPIEGCAAVLEEPIPLSSIEGFIQFAKLAYDRRISPLPESPWKSTVEKVMQTIFLFEKAQYFQDSETFQEHACRISKIADTNKLPFLDRKKQIQMKEYKGLALYGMPDDIHCCTKWCFWCDSSDPVQVKEYIDHEVMEQLSKLKMEWTKETETSPYAALSYGGTYHCETITAMNMLLQLLVWCINSTSTRNRESNDFDITEVESKMEYIRNIIRRTKNLC